jgi:pyrroline-5-carboxylate reductase
MPVDSVRYNFAHRKLKFQRGAPMKNTKIAFIGGGNMARSLIGGLIVDGCDPENLWVSDPSAEQRQTLRGHFAVHTGTDNNEVASQVSVVVLAVKPQVLHRVAAGLAQTIQARQPLVISIVAGVREKELCAWLGGDVALVRCMPNTPALVGSGATALFGNQRVSDEQRQLAESILRAVGLTVWVSDEALLDVVTALSGSGPAYFFLVMEALEKGAVKLGLNPEIARLLTLQTAFGAAKMALESMEDAAALRALVTSPGGTTEQGIAALQDGKLENLFASALEAASHRSRQLGDLLGGRP